MRPPRDSEGRNGVGVPVQELTLTTAAEAAARQLLPPRGGQRIVVIHEAEPGIGRPDVLLLCIWSRSLSRVATHPRLRTLTEARVLGAIARIGDGSSGGDAVGLSRDHYRRLRAGLQESGWISPTRRLAIPSPMVADSLLIEAKIADWRGGITQLARLRWLAHRAALLIPEASVRLVDRRALKRYDLGLLSMTSTDTIRRIRTPQPLPLSRLGQVWLDELALRAVDQGL